MHSYTIIWNEYNNYGNIPLEVKSWTNREQLIQLQPQQTIGSNLCSSDCIFKVTPNNAVASGCLDQEAEIYRLTNWQNMSLTIWTYK